MNTPPPECGTTAHSRELMVARQAQGRPVAQIAEEFGVFSRIVYIYGRLSLRKRFEAVI
ncbi:MAG: hypothetical protein AAF909_05595 [Pseudomonadota bacterium]